ncbi:MAG TPA: VWA domain-containing protein [Vicinamibacterales bacterium]|jgi:VWFA-related protein
MASLTRKGTAGAAFLLFLIARGHAQAPQQQQQSQQQQQQGGQQAAGQQPTGQAGQETQQPPTFRTGINFVRVDVIISDKNGNPVGDLQQSDFDLTEDGKPQKIESFKLIKLDGGTADAMKEPVKQIRTDYDEEAEAARDDVRLFAFFLDDYHVRRGASMVARGQLAKFVATQLGPSDMIGVMYPLESTASVRMTRNHEAVEKGLQQFLGRKYEYEPKNQFEEKYAYYPTETVERIRVQVSLSAIKSLIVHMGSLKEGRKTLILVSEGFTYMVPPQMRSANAQMPGLGNPNAYNPNAGTNDINEDRASWSASMDLESDLRDIYDAANRNNVAIYSVDPRGLAGFEFDINESVGFQTDSKYLNSTMDTLRTLSENTDGRAIVNRNDIAAGMQQIARDSSAYYLIGYNSSQAPSDGKFHEIKVKVKRPGVQVRARKGYWAMTAQDTARALNPSKITPPKPVENALNAAVTRPSSAAVVRTWVGTTRGDNGKTRMTFVWEPIQKAPGDAASSRSEPAARVSLMAVGTDGSPFYRGKIEAGAAAGSPGQVNVSRGGTVSFDVNPGKVQLRVSVEGASSQVLDTETRELTVPDLTGPQALLGTPAVFRARTLRDYQALKTDAGAMPIATREFSRTDRILVRVPTLGPAGTTPALSVHLLNRAGQAMSEIQPTPSPKEGEQQIDVPLSGLAPGEYLVEIKAKGDAGDAQELVAFRVTG